MFTKNECVERKSFLFFDLYCIDLASTPRTSVAVVEPFQSTVQIDFRRKVVRRIAGEAKPLGRAVAGVGPAASAVKAFEPDGQVVGCSISPLRQIESVVIDSSAFTKISPDLYRLSFALKNTAPVSVRFFFDSFWQAPLIIVVLAFFAGGALLGVLSLMGTIFGLRREVSRLKREANQTQKINPV